MGKFDKKSLDTLLASKWNSREGVYKFIITLLRGVEINILSILMVSNKYI